MSVWADMLQKNSSISEREALWDYSETCYDAWFEECAVVKKTRDRANLMFYFLFLTLVWLPSYIYIYIYIYLHQYRLIIYGKSTIQSIRIIARLCNSYMCTCGFVWWLLMLIDFILFIIRIYLHAHNLNTQNFSNTTIVNVCECVLRFEVFYFLNVLNNIYIWLYYTAYFCHFCVQLASNWI